MRRLLPQALVALISIALSSADASLPPTTNASHLPLFPPATHSLRTYHTSLSSLLPILPILSPPPGNNLAVTFATLSFRDMLYNWMCFVKYKAKWGEQVKMRWGEELEYDRTYENLLKVLVVTSDEALAKELSGLGVVVWYLNSVDLSHNNSDLSDEELNKALADDLFFNLRLLQLLLPPHKEGAIQTGENGEEELKEDMRATMMQWGTLHYQSLMLERSLVMSTLVGALYDSQKLTEEERLAQIDDWQRKREAHNYETGPLHKDPFDGVKGVLVVDNDAVWYVSSHLLSVHGGSYTDLQVERHRLSSPSSYLSHPYRPGGTHPSVIWSADSPIDFMNGYGSYSLPCACFFYSRVFDHSSAAPTQPDTAVIPGYSPAKLSADLWRLVALCHISMLLEALENGRRQARMWGESGEAVEDFKEAQAPSFQGTCLGPAIRIMEREREDAEEDLPELTHAEWLDALGSGNSDDMIALLEDFDLYTGGDGEDVPDGIPKPSCRTRAGKTHKTCPNIETTSLTNPNHHIAHLRLRSEPLPYGLFPPGMSYFGGEEKEEGVKPCVVHANYALGDYKMQLLKEGGFWALVKGDEREGGQWMCDREVMERA